MNFIPTDEQILAGKKCRKCGTVKPLTDFYEHALCKDGFLNQCKGCKQAWAHTYHKAKRQAKKSERLAAAE